MTLTDLKIIREALFYYYVRLSHTAEINHPIELLLNKIDVMIEAKSSKEVE